MQYSVTFFFKEFFFVLLFSNYNELRYAVKRQVLGNYKWLKMLVIDLFIIWFITVFSVKCFWDVFIQCFGVLFLFFFPPSFLHWGSQSSEFCFLSCSTTEPQFLYTITLIESVMCRCLCRNSKRDTWAVTDSWVTVA